MKMRSEEKDVHFTGYNSNLLAQARSLRREMTPEEKKLWYDYCKISPHKFYRQRSIDRFIVDFYCSKAKLVIEIDGAPHFTQDGKAYDKIRSEILEQYGLSVIRITNRQIKDHFDDVCKMLDRIVDERTRGLDATS